MKKLKWVLSGPDRWTITDPWGRKTTGNLKEVLADFILKLYGTENAVGVIRDTTTIVEKERKQARQETLPGGYKKPGSKY